MHSNMPKVLHTLAGKPMVKHVIDTCNNLGAQNIHLVYGHGATRYSKLWRTKTSTGFCKRSNWEQGTP